LGIDFCQAKAKQVTTGFGFPVDQGIKCAGLLFDLFPHPSHQAKETFEEQMRIACSPFCLFGMPKLFITSQSSLLELQIQSTSPKKLFPLTFTRLTIHGMNQATSLGAALKNEPITHIFSSDLKRAHRTAAAIASHHDTVTVVPDNVFRERDFGELEGKPWRQTWTSDNTTRSHATPEEGESKAAMSERATAAWNWVLQQAQVYENAHENLFVVVVSHGLFLSALFTNICAFYNTPRLANVFWANTAYVKFTVDHVRDPSFIVERINETSHLTAVQRQKGGVGSSKYDESQKTMKDFFIPSPKKGESYSSKPSFPFPLLFPPSPPL
jgi:broad specificity phosphatase PhoE